MSLSLHTSPAHGGQLRQIAARYGIPAERLIDFSANINPAGPLDRRWMRCDGRLKIL